MVAGVPSYAGFRFPAEIISQCVWLYHRFPLSFREVEEMMLQRGVVVSHETVRQWCASTGTPTPTSYDADGPAPGTSGTPTRYSSKSMARPTTCGGRSISMGPCWTSWSPPDGTPRPQPGSFASCSRAWSTCRECWSPTSWAATKRRAAQGCPLDRASPVEVSEQPGG